MARFRRGCPLRPYTKHARADRPARCPCTWSDWIIGSNFRAIMQPLDLEKLMKLFP